jgi:hypothetical protein
MRRKKKYTGTTAVIKAAALLIDGLVRQYNSPDDAALLANELIKQGWPPGLARQVTGCNTNYLHTARHLTPQEAELVASGAAKLYTFNGHGRGVNGNGAEI